MTTKQKRLLIRNAVKRINEICKTRYEYDNVPQYGGYNLHITGEHGEKYTGYLGFHGRMKADTFIEYLHGIEMGIYYCRTQQ